MKNKKIKITMIDISFKNLPTKEWPKQGQSQLLWCDRMFHWGILLYTPQE